MKRLSVIKPGAKLLDQDGREWTVEEVVSHRSGTTYTVSGHNGANHQTNYGMSKEAMEMSFRPDEPLSPQ